MIEDQEDPYAKYAQPKEDPYAKYLPKQPEAPASTGEPSSFVGGYSGLSFLGSGVVQGVKRTGQEMGNLFQRLAMKLGGDPVNAPILAPEEAAKNTNESIGRFGGSMLASAPLYAATGMGLGAIGETVASRLGIGGVGKALLTGSSEELPQAASKIAQFARAIGVAIPQEVTTNVIASGTLDPESVDSQKKLLINASLGALSAGFKGFSDLKDFHTQVSEASTVQGLREIKATIDRFPQHDPPLGINPPANPQSGYVSEGELPSAFQAADRNARQALDAAIQQRYDDLMSGKYLKTSELPKLSERHLDSIEQAHAEALAEQLKTRLDLKIVPRVGKGTRSIENIGVIGSSNAEKLGADELQGYYDMLSSFSPYKQAKLTGTKLRLENAAKKGFGFLDPLEAIGIQKDMMTMADRLAGGFDKLGPEKSFADVVGSKLTPSRSDGADASDILSNAAKPDLLKSRKVTEPLIVPASVYKGKTNFGNDYTVGKLENIGSGPQSSQAYVPPEIPNDPLSTILTSKTQDVPPQTLNTDEAEIAKHIDFGNKNAQADRLDRQYLLNSRFDKFKKNYVNFLTPIQKVSDEAFDAAQKLLRVSVRQREGIANRLSIPQPDGSYVDGPMSLPTVYKIAGEGNRDRFDIYAQARQVVAGEAKNTTLPLENAQNIVRDYPSQFPSVVQAYETAWKPLTNGIIDLKAGYKNSMMNKPSILEAMREKEAYASTARAVYQDRGMGGVNANKARGEVSSKQIADLASSTAQDIQNTIKNGEQSKLIWEFAKAKMNDPTISDDIVKIIPFEQPPGLEETIAGMDPDLPYAIKHSLAEGNLVHPADSRKFNIRTDEGTPITVQLGAELPETLKQLDNWSGGVSNKLNIPGSDLQRKVEKKASTIFSVARDMRFGIPADWFEFMINQSHGYKPFSDPVQFVKDFGKDLASPVKGFLAQHNQTDIIHKLQAAGAGASYHGDIPSSMSESIDKILGRNTGSKTTVRPSDWRSSFTNLASDMANAVRTGAALRDLENGKGYSEAATTFNNVLGDPYIVGAKLAAVSRHVAFMNYPIQANARILSNFTDPKKAAETVFKGTALLTAPTVALWYAQKDNEELRALRNDPDGKRYTYFANPMNDKDIMRIPKLYLYGALFQTPIESALDLMYSKAKGGDLSAKDAVKRVGEAALEQITPNFMPLTANAVLPLYTGQTVDPFQGSRQLVPKSRANLLPEDQGDAGTSVAARRISEATRIPAAVVENVFKTFLVGPTYTAYSLADDYIGSGSKPPTFNKFTLIPGVENADISKAGIKNINDFYDVVAKTQPILGSLQAAQSNGQPQRALEILSKNMDVLPQAKMIASFKRDMDAISEKINLVKQNEAWSPEQKKEEIGLLVGIRIQVAKNAMMGYRSMSEPSDKPSPNIVDKIKDSSGLIQSGNIDLNNRPIVKNPDGSISTIRSMSFEEDGQEILIPTVARDGSGILNEDQAIDQYHKTGQFLGKFRDAVSANKYAEKLHQDQAKLYLKK